MWLRHPETADYLARTPVVVGLPADAAFTRSGCRASNGASAPGRDRLGPVPFASRITVAHVSVRRPGFVRVVRTVAGRRPHGQNGGGSLSGFGAVVFIGESIVVVGVGGTGAGAGQAGSVSGPGGRVVRVIPVGVVMVRVPSAWKSRVQPGAWCLSR